MATDASSQNKNIFEIFYFLKNIKMAAASFFLKKKKKMYCRGALALEWKTTQKSKILLYLPKCKERNQTRLKSAILP